MKIAREAMPFAAGLGLAAVLFWILRPWLAAAPLVLLAFTLWFFRDPERKAPDDPGVAVSPADGRVIRAEQRSVSVFMNVFDVHVCRAPIAGRVESVRHTPGRFLAAFRDAASEQNERTRLELSRPGGSVAFTLIAGVIARRIVCKVAVGDLLRTGDRVGLIRFGSRVDVELPEDTRCTVRVGDRVKAGETVIARIPV